ncbi:MAG: nicotinate (nicotinamide) nucleotide adenylyltransferase [Firmicutes bacterium]|nr:nicotinate (nicotinamide) nucleotide adenylyltransferase [Bacillota bacterium]
MSKIKIFFGGSFDPPHLGHLLMAQLASEKLGAPVTFLPAGIPPHKQVRCTAAQRLEMVRLAIAGNTLFSVDDTEIKRREPAYTYETLEQLQARYQLQADSLYFLLGSDSVTELETWRNPERIAALCTLLVYPRQAWSELDLTGVRRSLNLRLEICDAPIVQISSTFIRQRIQQYKSVRYMLPEAVADFIAERGLYLKEKRV